MHTDGTDKAIHSCSRTAADVRIGALSINRSQVFAFARYTQACLSGCMRSISAWWAVPDRITLFGLRFARRGAAKDSRCAIFSGGQDGAVVGDWAVDCIRGDQYADDHRHACTRLHGDFGFLQIVIGYMLGRIVVAAIFLPKYFQGEMLTAYQLIDRRFGRALYKVTAGLFLLTRAAAEVCASSPSPSWSASPSGPETCCPSPSSPR